ncbi:hypothetical protein GCM10010353_60720 [Streptomyces chryseus]|nr:hypothetical protein GCM10010353_60720 [Streptomyces chryseus]
MTYLTEWRLALAADLLRQSDTTWNTGARQVGYGSGFPSARHSSGCRHRPTGASQSRVGPVSPGADGAAVEPGVTAVLLAPGGMARSAGGWASP